MKGKNAMLEHVQIRGTNTHNINCAVVNIIPVFNWSSTEHPHAIFCHRQYIWIP
jgi:hypothetical protein